MLAELAAANAAFQVIKQAVSNGKDIAAAGSAIAKFVGAKQDLERKSIKKGGGSDLEEFMALEEIKQKENELKQMMIYLGRPGLHSDYVRFCVEARKKRQEAAKEKERQWAAFVESFQTWFLIILLVLLGLGIMLGGVWILRYKGII